MKTLTWPPKAVLFNHCRKYAYDLEFLGDRTLNLSVPVPAGARNFVLVDQTLPCGASEALHLARIRLMSAEGHENTYIRLTSSPAFRPGRMSRTPPISVSTS